MLERVATVVMELWVSDGPRMGVVSVGVGTAILGRKSLWFVYVAMEVSRVAQGILQHQAGEPEV